MPSGPLLQGRSVIISGVGPGLGRKLALRCADEGARLTLGARSLEFLESVAAEVRAAGGRRSLYRRTSARRRIAAI